MQTFRCEHCNSVVFFENIRCEKCGNALGFVPDELRMGSFSVTESGTWLRHGEQADATPRWKPCANYAGMNVCNWMLAHDDPDTLCESCRYTEIIPALSKPENVHYWYLLEAAKRRLIYTLHKLRLPILSRREQPEGGLAFHFKEDVGDAEKVFTGHDSGLITINIIEADDVKREASRISMHEPYRTLLGHFRHESGHFYWDQLIAGSPWLERCRALFGDERADYGVALQAHYDNGPQAGWELTHVSAYATSHPWEDWAETWAHYLHVIDALDTATHWKATLNGESFSTPLERDTRGGFRDTLLRRWAPLSQFLNSMNRSLGQHDIYPFLLPDAVIEKLSFVDEVVRASASKAMPAVPSVPSARAAA